MPAVPVAVAPREVVVLPEAVVASAPVDVAAHRSVVAVVPGVALRSVVVAVALLEAAAGVVTKLLASSPARSGRV